jgi:murein DD-endopeptidase MepM/ murein hydrolase activator NlpD
LIKNLMRRRNINIVLLISIFIMPGLACKLIPDTENNNRSNMNDPLFFQRPTTPTMTSWLPPTRIPGSPQLTPTPDPPHYIPSLQLGPEEYIVQPNDTLSQIAERFGANVEDIMEANDILYPDWISVGLNLHIPQPPVGEPAPDFKIIPDSELVNGPVSAYFDIHEIIQRHDGYLASYSEEIGGTFMTGSQIVETVASNYSINPRLLLAVLEYQSGWLTERHPQADTMDFPIGFFDLYRTGLYRQLAWVADNLNRGYYLWKVNAVSDWMNIEGVRIPVSPTINAGSAGVQYLFSLLYFEDQWREAVAADGLYTTYASLFGHPFDLAIEPLVPPELTQPPFQLPFEPGTLWVFTGGPHGGWDNGSAWAALDFAPFGDPLGCVTSDAWVVAVADGFIVRSENGAVVQDLDGDNMAQTGWTIFYMHIETRDRVQVGQYLHAGDPIGHPSCEGGISSGTHVHIARRYNGEWIPADGPILFVMDNWVSIGNGILYDGVMQRGDQEVESCECQEIENTLQR